MKISNELLRLIYFSCARYNYLKAFGGKSVIQNSLIRCIQGLLLLITDKTKLM